MARSLGGAWSNLSSSLIPSAYGKRSIYLSGKRAFDLVFSLLLLLLLAPLCLLIALAIRGDSSGPALFVQERMGYDWRRDRLRPFRFYKFRSMYSGCDQEVHRDHVHRCIHGQPQSPATQASTELVKLVEDPRITPVGRILRRSSLDELPQLWNVLKGEMSLVGPRPVPLYEVAEYEPWHRQRLRATPGMTGLWQIAGRGHTTLDEMCRLDIEYIARQSPWLDVAILLRTIPAVIGGSGAK